MPCGVVVTLGAAVFSGDVPGTLDFDAITVELVLEIPVTDNCDVEATVDEEFKGADITVTDVPSPVLDG